MYLFERMTHREGETEREIIYFLAYSPNNYNCWSWAMQKPGEPAIHLISHVAGVTQAHGQSEAALAGALTGSWIGSRVARN